MRDRQTPRQGRLAVVGAGYVGLRVMAAAVAAGWHVDAYDREPSRMALLGGGIHLDETSAGTLADSLSTGQCIPRDIARGVQPFEAAVICVQTPLSDDLPDISQIRAAARLVGGALDPGGLVALESTSWPGTTEDILIPELEDASGLTAGCDFHVAFSPERIDPGSSSWSLANTPKLVAGLTPSCTARASALYRELVSEVVEVDGIKEAELAKLIENTFRFVNISLVNELSVIAHELGIDFRESLTAASTKPFGFMRFDPGPGIGGHCIPVDPLFLREYVRTRLAREVRMIAAAADVNRQMPTVICQRIVRALGDPSGRLDGLRILMIGLSYKPGIGDTRGSPAYPLSAALQNLGAMVFCLDPLVPRDALPPGAQWAETREEVEHLDATVILADHDGLDLNRLVQTTRWSLDCRGTTPAAQERLW